jgi:hypothetical protein
VLRKKQLTTKGKKQANMNKQDTPLEDAPNP